MRVVEQLRHVAEQQHGVVSRAQCRALGLDRDGLRDRRLRGEWVHLSPRVVRVVGCPRTDRTGLMAAVLDAGRGAVASHRSAAALWGLPGFRVDACDVLRPHDADRHRPVLGRLHRTRSLPSHHVTSVEGIPVTTPARALFDLAGTLDRRRTERAVDNALAKSPSLLGVLHRMLPEIAERGRTGITVMRAVLGDRPERLHRAGFGVGVPCHHVAGRGGHRHPTAVDLGGADWIGRVDLLVTGTRLVVEVDSRRFHTSLLDRERDERRDAELRSAGYEVLRVAEEEVWYTPAEMVMRVRAATRRAA